MKMKIITSIFVCFALSVIVEGNIMVKVAKIASELKIVEPFFLSVGTVLTGYKIRNE